MTRPEKTMRMAMNTAGFMNNTTYKGYNIEGSFKVLLMIMIKNYICQQISIREFYIASI